MSDYDIVIKLDPGQPVLSTKQIAAALAELEKQGKKTKEEVEGVGKGVQSLNFKQAERGARSLAEAHAQQSANMRETPPMIEQLLATLERLGARDKLLPAIRTMTAALDEHRRALDEVIAELERLAGAAS